MSKVIHRKICFSLPEAAKVIGVTHMTLWRWTQRKNSPIKIEVFQDIRNKRRYITAESIKRLKNRFQTL